MPTITTATTVALRAGGVLAVTARAGASGTAAVTRPGSLAQSTALTALVPYSFGPYAQAQNIVLTPAAGTFEYTVSYATQGNEAVLPPAYAWANRPDPAAVPVGFMVRVIDAGVGAGGLFINDGTRWSPVNGTLMLARLQAATGNIANTETNVMRALLPVNFLQQYDTMRLWLCPAKSGTTDACQLTVRIGVLGDNTDTALTGLSAQTVLTAANRSTGVIFDMKLMSATSMQKQGNAASGVSGYGSAGATGAAVATTIADASANALYVSVNILSSSTNDTVSAASGSLQLIAG